MEVSSTRERWPASNTLIVPISRYVLMYKISEPLGRVGEELKGVGEGKIRDIITKFNTFESTNLIPAVFQD